MLSGISITCFAASYATALALEVARLFLRSGARRALSLGFAGAGVFAHTVFLGYQATSAAGLPLSSRQDWYLIAAWVLALAYLYLAVYHPRNAFGVFVLPLVLGLVGVGALVADARPFAREPASQVWGAIHGTAVLLATVTVLAGFAAGVMYFWQSVRLKRKRPPSLGLRLPSLEWLERANSRAIVVSLLFLSVGILAGVVLNLINPQRHTSQVPWGDPFIVSTLAMFGWLLVASVVGVLYRPTREGRRVAFFTVVSFIFLVLALSVGLFFDTQHDGAAPPAERAGAVAGAAAGAPGGPP